MQDDEEDRYRAPALDKGLDILELLASVDHPAIVRYVAHGVFDETLYLAMQWLEGESLTDRLEAGGILIAPVGPHHGVQTLVRVVRTETGFDRKELVDVRFVPALPGIAREL